MPKQLRGLYRSFSINPLIIGVASTLQQQRNCDHVAALLYDVSPMRACGNGLLEKRALRGIFAPRIQRQLLG